MPVKKSGSAVDRLTDATPATPPPPASKKKTAPVILLEGDAAATFDRYTSADAIVKVAGAGQSEARGKVVEAAAHEFLRLCITQGYAVANPQLATAQSRASFQVKHVSALIVEEDENGKVIPIQDRLTDAGFSEQVAREIVTELLAKEVVKTRESLRVKSLTEMADSENPAQRAVAERIAKYVEKWLTPEDRALMMEKVLTTTIEPHWKDVAVAAACRIGGEDLDKGVEVLGKLFAVIPVQFAVSGAAYTGNLGEAFGKLVPKTLSDIPPPAV